MEYKALTSDNKGPHSGFDFAPYLPTKRKNGTWKAGKWPPKVEELEMCESGYHTANSNTIIEWLNENIYEVETRGKKLKGDTKNAFQQIRLIRKCEGWNEKTARLFACDCAERVLPIYEKKYNDPRPRNAINTARLFAEGKATREELAAARDAAWDAAWAAAWDAAGDAARAAAWDAAWAAAWDAARAAERKWQIKQLKKLLK